MPNDRPPRPSTAARLHSAFRRAIPRSPEASAALRGVASSVRSGAPSWLAAAAIAGSMQLAPSEAHADPGSVRLRNGGRVRGDVVAVLPSDRVVVMLADGTSITVPWADVLFVFDGMRVYDSLGNVETLDPSPSPSPPVAAPAPPDPSPAPAEAAPSSDDHEAPPAPFVGAAYRLRPIASDPEAYARLRQLPNRGPALAEITFGSLFLTGGFMTMVAGAIIQANTYGYGDCSSCGPSAGVTLVLPGVLSMGLGAAMVGIGGHRLHKRKAGIQELQRHGFFVVGVNDSVGLAIDADVGPGRVVPRVTLRF